MVVEGGLLRGQREVDAVLGKEEGGAVGSMLLGVGEVEWLLVGHRVLLR